MATSGEPTKHHIWMIEIRIIAKKARSCRLFSVPSPRKCDVPHVAFWAPSSSGASTMLYEAMYAATSSASHFMSSRAVMGEFVTGSIAVGGSDVGGEPALKSPEQQMVM